MSVDLFIIGAIYIVVPVLLSPFHMRVIYIFLVRHEFKALECYKILSMICLSNVTYGLCYVPMGFSILTQSDLGGVTIVAFKLWMASWATIVALDLALAVNRLFLICNIYFLRSVSKYIHFAALVYPTVLMVVMLSRLADIVFLKQNVFFTYDLSKPLSEPIRHIHGLHNLICVTVTVVVYIFITAYLIVQKCRHKAIGMSLAERSVAAQAVVKFSANMFVLVTMNFFGKFFQKSFWTMAAIPLFQIFNLLVLSLLVYIGFNRSLRKLFFKRNVNPLMAAVTRLPA
uniref:G protein-coupled receptor n=1 Tax=Steinernema glaseri TaxID=37863 RepID=A0A1I7Z4C8_9BILA